VAGLVTALLASACDTAQQVPWVTYSSQLQPRIDAATATRNCAALQVFLTAAKTASQAHEKATGFPNDALVSYIKASQHQAGCPQRPADRLPPRQRRLTSLGHNTASQINIGRSGRLA
jgi:hypothetical protein